MAKKHICLIAPGHVSSCPRIVKEADALVEAGYEVTLVSGRTFEPAVVLDRAILARARWAHREIATSRGVRACLRRVARKALQIARPSNVGLAAAELLTSPRQPALVRAAIQTGADLYHGHCLGGLAAAAVAARRTGKRFSFDVEDFHEEESDAVVSNPMERAAVARVMHDHLPRAVFVTAASPLIAEACRERYGVAATPLLNAFQPLPTAGTRVREAFSEQSPARLYWFSQTVGPGRGLEEMITVAALMRVPCVLRFRGFVAASYRSVLMATATKARVRVEFLPPAPPDEMVRLAAEADLGLSLERSSPPNRDICLTNKIFVYLAAGLPQAMSPTRAQAAFAQELGEAAVVMKGVDAAADAAALDLLLSDASSLKRSQEAARKMGQASSWDSQKTKFLAAVEGVMRMTA